MRLFLGVLLGHVMSEWESIGHVFDDYYSSITFNITLKDEKIPKELIAATPFITTPINSCFMSLPLNRSLIEQHLIRSIRSYPGCWKSTHEFYFMKVCQDKVIQYLTLGETRDEITAKYILVYIRNFLIQQGYSNDENIQVNKSPISGNFYLQQIMRLGDRCGVEGPHRYATIYYTCGDLGIFYMAEPEACVYEIYIETSIVCRDPGLIECYSKS